MLGGSRVAGRQSAEDMHGDACAPGVETAAEGLTNGSTYSSEIFTDEAREALRRYCLSDEEIDCDMGCASAGSRVLSGPHVDGGVGVEAEGDVRQYAGPEYDEVEDFEWYSGAGNEAAYCQAATESHNASVEDGVGGWR